MEASLENSIEKVLLETSEEGAATTGDFIAIAIDESFKADGQASQPRVVGFHISVHSVFSHHLLASQFFHISP